MKKRSLREQGTLYILTDYPNEYPKDIAFELPCRGGALTFELNGEEHRCEDENIFNCDNSAHRPDQRAEYVLSIAIKAYQNKIGEMPKNIHMRWLDMETSSPTPKDLSLIHI